MVIKVDPLNDDTFGIRKGILRKRCPSFRSELILHWDEVLRIELCAFEGVQ